MNAKEVEKIFERQSENYDQKHILNLRPNKVIPQEIIDGLGVDGLTIEDVDSLTSKGYPVCKYRTQITVHGVCNQLKTKYSQGYVSLVKNKNLSVGIRWIAIDSTKRNKIYEKARLYGWKREKNSQCDYFYQIASYTQDNIFHFKEIVNRIDTNLFYGNCSCVVMRDICSNFLLLRLSVFGIYEQNVDKLICLMCNEEMYEINKKLADAIEKRRHEREAMDNEIEAASQRENERKNKWKAENPIPEGFDIVDSLQVGDIICYLKKDTDYSQKDEYGRYIINYSWGFRLVYKAGATLCAKDCDIDGKPLSRHGNGIAHLDKKRYVKRVTEKKLASDVTIKPYKDGLIVCGNTYPIRAKLKDAGGKWNKFQVGWMFPKSKKAELESMLS